MYVYFSLAVPRAPSPVQRIPFFSEPPRGWALFPAPRRLSVARRRDDSLDCGTAAPGEGDPLSLRCPYATGGFLIGARVALSPFLPTGGPLLPLPSIRKTLSIVIRDARKSVCVYRAFRIQCYAADVTFEIGLLLVIVLTALVFFSFEWVAADVVALGVVLALVLTGLLPAKKAFAGFGSDTVIMILGLLIMTTALMKTGLVDVVGRAIVRRAGDRPLVLLFVIMLSVALLSAFISNTAAAAFFVPVTLGIAAKAKISPSRLLMPVAFSSILTSSVSLISTSTNLVVNGIMTQIGLAPMGMFELAPVGVPIAVVGLLYMFYLGRRWIPERAQSADLIEQFGVREYLTEVLVLPASPLVGKSLADSNLGRDLDLSVVRIAREPGELLLPRPHLKIAAGDVLLVKGAREEILKVKDTTGIEIRPDVALSDPDLKSDESALVEVLISRVSPLAGRTLKALGFRERYGVQVLGLNRHGRNVLRKLGHVRVRPGDVLLVQGRKSNITALSDEHVFQVLNAVNERRLDRPRAWRATLIFCGALIVATANIMPLSVAVLLGAFLMFATRCITPADAYRDLTWQAVILIGCMLALGEAMVATGAAQYLASGVAALTQGLSPVALLGGFFVLTVLLTQPMSNQAAAAVILPIAIQTATHLQLNPRTFTMMIAVAASCSYLTPLEPACLMVYGPGRYRFVDFLRIGGPLVFLLFGIAIWLVPKFWPL